MRAENTCQRRIEFRLDAISRQFQFRKRLLEGLPQAIPFAAPLPPERPSAECRRSRARRPRPMPGPFPSRARCCDRSGGLPAVSVRRPAPCCPSIDMSLENQIRIESRRCTQVTANEPSPTANPTRLVEPLRISPAANTPGIVVSSGQGSRSGSGHRPERSTSEPVNKYPLSSRANCGRQPLGTRFGSDEHKHRRTGKLPRSFAVLGLQRNRLQAAVAGKRVDLSLLVDDDVAGRANAVRQVFRHAGPKLVADERVHRALRAALGEKHDRLSGRVSSSDDGDVALIEEIGFHRRARVINPAPVKRVGSRRPRVAASGLPSPAARRDILISAPQSNFSMCRSSGLFAGVSFSTLTGATIFAPNLSICSTPAHGEIGAAQAGGKTDEIFDPRRTPRLTAWSQAVQHQCRKPLGGRVDGRGHTRRARRRRSPDRLPAQDNISKSRPRGPDRSETDSPGPCRRRRRSPAFASARPATETSAARPQFPGRTR